MSFKIKIIKQLPEALISDDVLSVVSSDKRGSFFALLLESDRITKGHIVRFENDFSARCMSYAEKYDNMYFYSFLSPSCDKFDWSIHVGDSKELIVVYGN